MGSILTTAYKSLPDFNKFSKFVLENQKQISPRVFSEEFGKIQRNFFAGPNRDLFCSEADNLAAKLLEQNNNDFAGIIYSGLCKVTEFFPAELEKFALKGYGIAKAKGDYVHMMARLNNLRKVYMGRADKLFDYIQVLYKQEKCLKELTRNYDIAVGTYQSVTRKAASKEDYKQMLAYVQTEIGKLTKKKHPNDAAKKLMSARKIFDESGNKQSVKYIDMLLKELTKL